jgi:hypothetical protein
MVEIKVMYQGFQFRPANGEFRQTFSFNPTQIRQSFYVYAHIIGFPVGSTPGLTMEIVKAARQNWQIPRGVG